MYYVRKTLSCQQKEILTSSEFQIPALRKNCSYLEFFWFVFSRIQTGTFYILTDFNRLKRRNSLTNFYIQRIYTSEIWGVQDFQLHGGPPPPPPPHPPTPHPTPPPSHPGHPMKFPSGELLPDFCPSDRFSLNISPLNNYPGQLSPTKFLLGQVPTDFLPWPITPK